MITPSVGAPFDVHQIMKATQYGYPGVYPNSENIKPPAKKERLRVVEAATRTEIRLNQIKDIEERAKEIKTLRELASLRYASNGKKVVTEIEARIIDIKV